MRFQSKLQLVYLLLVVTLVMIIGAVFYIGSVNELERKANTSLNALAGKMTQQLDSLIRPMDFISLNLISNGTFMSSMKSLVMLDRSNPANQRFISDAYVEINRALMNYTIARDYYRVSMFNHNGDFLTSKSSFNVERKQYKEVIEDIGWTHLADQNNGKIVIIPPYNDSWEEKQQIRVFGVCRTIRGMESNIGYLEVQAAYRDLEKVFHVENESQTSVLAITKEGGILYISGINDPEQFDFYLERIRLGNSPAASLRVPGSSYGQIVTVSGSEYTGVRILLAQNREALLQPVWTIIRTTVISSAAIMVLSFVYILIIGRHLTKPIRKLKEEMEQTSFETLPDKINLPSSNDEIEALNRAFIHLRERLNESIKREIHAQDLQLQASFESLQARINPHFIYNILNVLSNRGILHGDTVICDICQSIASMLRYSTSTDDMTALLSEELEHVKNYLNLMKKRFEYRLSYSIHVEPSLLTIRVPKIVLQPLVENSINHGFVDIDRDKKIDILGYRRGNQWYIELHDNGQGFDDDILANLREKMKKTGEMTALSGNGAGIGGMGIINVYSRLLLHFYPLPFDLFIQNKPEGGACVTLCGQFREEVKPDETENSSCG